ncbi:MAG: oligosaccharide flippase family protein, partial [Trebonia sp.]
WLGFLSGRPDRSLANDIVFTAVQAATFGVVIALHVHSLALVIACWGAGATAGTLYGLHQYGVRPGLSGGVALLRARWSISKWLAGDSLLNSGADQLVVFLTGAVLGSARLGGFRAAYTLASGPSMMLIQAGGSIGLPEAAKYYEDEGWAGLTRVARVVSVTGLLSVLACAIAIALWGRALLSTIYGAEFARYQVAALLIAVGWLVASLALGPVLVLKTTRNTRCLFRVKIAQVTTTIASVTILATLYGVNGAAASSIVTLAVNSAGTMWYRRRIRRSDAPDIVTRRLGYPVAGAHHHSGSLSGVRNMR